MHSSKKHAIQKPELQFEEWERVLWKKQNYPDNFVGKSFIRVQTDCVKVSLGQAFYGSVLVTQEICSCFGLVAIFWGVSDKQISTSSVLFATGLLSCIGVLLTHVPKFFNAKSEEKKMVLSTYCDELKAASFTVVLSWFLSPIIKTLTGSVATDTIHACTIGLLLLHLCLHSYGANVAIVNPTMSHNLGLFAAVCLASRLSNDIDVFAFVLVAIGFFHLLPSFSCFFRGAYGKASFMAMTLAIFVVSLYGLQQFAPSLCFFYFLVPLFVNGFAPLLFIYLQPYRKNIYGPWDEALIKE